ncbi:MAG: signal peptidase I [Desulfobacteraceae bacterium]|nr:signal peptidase I [Desulfobacteraceae bacterium]
MKRRWKNHLRMFWKGWGCSLFVALVIATSFKSAIADWNVVPTGSMKPTLVEGDRIFVNKLAYDLKIPYTTLHIAEWCEPKRGDIVVFYSPADGERLVKRVVGIPGDSVSMRNNRVVLNGKRLRYEAIQHLRADDPSSGGDADTYRLWENLGEAPHPIWISPGHPAPRSFGPVTVPEESYLVLGDNRDNSADSRYFGFLRRSRIVGRADFIVVSLDINDNYKPRWERFLTDLP